MVSSGKREWVTWFVAALLLVVCGLIGWKLWWGSSTLPVVDRAPNFTLTDMYGRTVPLRESDGKVRIVSFHYTRCPDICQATNFKLLRLAEQLRKEKLLAERVLLMTISFDSKYDTEAVLKQYTDRTGMKQDGWLFLRGSQEQTKQVLKGFKVLAEEQDGGLFMHSNQLFLLDGSQNIRAVYRMGSELDTDAMLADIHALLEDK
ncbi:protein SCO1/2 [Aneurinibacillus soli]|uniref:Uncharacterized protein n=2 Tax=Aneurinibacillus soli TaxID=1500254 RepID=A0A0U5B4S4_9BACL|nr:SCO family protein [Aneurinibacillus soli]PYE59332.1 protein SCO1/2 [Aneurinibacillus soli]BAU26678.1 hypothetical protein CB4_00820 [Aneurinibacillus soli]